MSPGKLVRVTATLPASLVRAADGLAQDLGASRSALLAQALSAFLRRGQLEASTPQRVGGAPAPAYEPQAGGLARAGDGALLAELGRRLARAAPPTTTPASAEGRPRIPVDAAVLADLCRRHHIRRLALFGSVLRDDFGPASDVDVLVEFEPGQTIGFEIITIEEDLSALFGGRRVDVVIEKYLNPRLRDRVLASAQVQYAA